MTQTRIPALALAAVLLLVAAAAAPALPAQSAADSARRLSLDDALGLADLTSDDIAIARSGVTRAEGQQLKARSQFLPQIYGSASYTRTLKSQFEGLTSSSDTAGSPPRCDTFHPDPTQPLADRVGLLEQALGCSSGNNIFGNLSQAGFGAENQYNLGLTLSQNLFTGGRISAQSREAGAARQTADIALTAARAQVMLQVTQAYYDAVLGDRLVGIAEATLAQAETTLVQTRLARQVGNQPEFDLLRAQVTRDNQVPVVIQQRAARDLAYLRLKQALNIPLGEPLELTTTLGDTASAPSSRVAALLATTPDTSVDRRAPVRQASENVVAQRSAVTVAKSQRVPTLTLSSQFGRVAYPPNGLPAWDAFRTNWTITGAIQVPLFTGGSIRGDEMVAEANLREAEARLRQMRRLAGVDARDAMSQLEAAQAQFAASQGTVGQADKAYQIAEVRYREGISTQTELTDSRIQLQQAQANRAQASRDLQVARIRVALLRDLPLSAAGASVTPSTGGALSLPSTQQQAPRAPQQTPQPGVATQASQAGVNPDE